MTIRWARNQIATIRPLTPAVPVTHVVSKNVGWPEVFHFIPENCDSNALGYLRALMYGELTVFLMPTIYQNSTPGYRQEVVAMLSTARKMRKLVNLSRPH